MSVRPDRARDLENQRARAGAPYALGESSMLRLSFASTLTALTLFGATAFADEPGEPNIVVEPPITNAPSPPPTVDGPKAHVKVTTTVTVYLQQFIEAENKWIDVCTAPCEADVIQ